MRQTRAVAHAPADLLALQALAERAGCALACDYSSSDEYEAAIIRSKRDAGVYGPKRLLRYLMYAATAFCALAILNLML